MLTSHYDNLSTYIPSLFRHATSSRQTTQQYFRAVAMSSRKKRKRLSCFCPKRAVKGKKKGNCFDKDWADKHATSDKGSYYKQHEFEEGKDFEEGATNTCINDFSNHMKLLSKGSDDEVRGIRRQALLRWQFLFHWSQW